MWNVIMNVLAAGVVGAIVFMAVWTMTIDYWSPRIDEFRQSNRPTQERKIP